MAKCKSAQPFDLIPCTVDLDLGACKVDLLLNKEVCCLLLLHGRNLVTVAERGLPAVEKFETTSASSSPAVALASVCASWVSKTHFPVQFVF